MCSEGVIIFQTDSKTVWQGSITVDKQLQSKIFDELNKQYKNIRIVHGDPKFCIMNKIAYQQYYAYCVENHQFAPDQIFGIPIVLDWTSEELIKLKMGAYDEWKLLDIEDME